MVKNSADVIETCIRANGLLVDNFVILNNMCSDRTIEILEKLKLEGFDIEIIRDDTIEYTQQIKMTQLIYDVNERYNPDFIIPIDDDEIIVPASKKDTMKDLRHKIKSLSQSNLYYLQWKVYLPTKYDDYDEICVVKRQKFCYGDQASTLEKIIIPTKLLEDRTFSVVLGNHGGNGKLIQHRVVIDFARMAHFPCRSEEQLRSKVLTGWTNFLALPNETDRVAFHWKKLYSIAKKGNPLTLQDMQRMTLHYAMFKNPDTIQINYDPVNLPEECLIIKYTHKNEINIWENYCNNVENLASKYAELLKRKE